MTALLLSNLVLGLISRTLPQINVIAVGFGVNSLLALGMLFLSIGAVAWTFQEPTVDVMQQIARGSGKPLGDSPRKPQANRKLIVDLVLALDS